MSKTAQIIHHYEVLKNKPLDEPIVRVIAEKMHYTLNKNGSHSFVERVITKHKTLTTGIV